MSIDSIRKRANLPDVINSVISLLLLHNMDFSIEQEVGKTTFSIKQEDKQKDIVIDHEDLEQTFEASDYYAYNKLAPHFWQITWIENPISYFPSECTC